MARELGKVNDVQIFCKGFGPPLSCGPSLSLCGPPSSKSGRSWISLEILECYKCNWDVIRSLVFVITHETLLSYVIFVVIMLFVDVRCE